MPLSVTTAPPVEGKPRPCDDEFEGEDLILKIEIREDLPREKDGPMLIHGMQGFQGRRIHVPGARSFRPAEELLEERYERFRRAV